MDSCWRAHPVSVASNNASSKCSGRTPSPKTRGLDPDVEVVRDLDRADG